MLLLQPLAVRPVGGRTEYSACRTVTSPDRWRDGEYGCATHRDPAADSIRRPRAVRRFSPHWMISVHRRIAHTLRFSVERREINNHEVFHGTDRPGSAAGPHRRIHDSIGDLSISPLRTLD